MKSLNKEYVKRRGLLKLGKACKGETYEEVTLRRDWKLKRQNLVSDSIHLYKVLNLIHDIRSQDSAYSWEIMTKRWHKVDS